MCTPSLEYGGCTKQDDYGGPDLGYQSSWYYRDDPVRGVLEIADLALKVTWIDRLLLFREKYKRMTYVVGKEIPWGGHSETIGDRHTWDVVIDWLRSNYVGFPGWGYRGTQTVHYMKHLDTFTDNLGMVYHDVIKIQMWQPWDRWDHSDLTSPGCVYWLARGVGRVAVQWLNYGHDLQVISSYDPVCARYTPL